MARRLTGNFWLDYVQINETAMKQATSVYTSHF